MVRQTLAQEITQYLTEQGAVRVGFADLHGVAGASLPYGITALVALPREIVGPLVDQPHRAYYDAYQAINVRLDAMAEGCAALLRAHGYQATANTEEHLPTGAEDRSPLPHKAVACPGGTGLDREEQPPDHPRLRWSRAAVYRGDGCPAAYGGAYSLQPLRQLPSVRGRLSLLRSVRHPVAHGAGPGRSVRPPAV